MMPGVSMGMLARLDRWIEGTIVPVIELTLVGVRVHDKEAHTCHTCFLTLPSIPD